MNFLSELSFRVSFSQRHTLTVTVSEVQPKFDSRVSFSDSFRAKIQRNLSLTCDKHVNTSVSVRILRNLQKLGLILLDVLGLLVHSSLG